MGYYVTLTETNAYIPTDKLDEAYRLLCALNQRNDLKTGGSGHYAYGRTPEGETPIVGPHKDVWFSWMDWNYPDVYTTAEEILGAVGYDTHTDERGLHFVRYDNKHGCEHTFAHALAPVLASSDNELVHFTWSGEDGELWRDLRKADNAFHSQVGEVIYR